MESMKEVIVDTRKLSRVERVLLVGNAIKKTSNGEITVLVDKNHSKKEVSYAAGREGWRLKGIKTWGKSLRITIQPLVACSRR
jgi:hypothetical protein